MRVGEHKLEAVTCGGFVVRSPRELRLHRALDELRLTASVEELNEVARPDPRLQQPILIAKDGTILDGVARWRLALLNGQEEVHCIEYHLGEEDCLKFILMRHHSRRGWNAFVRIRLALTLEPILQQRAHDNMSAGGKNKGSANLPEAHHIDVRQKIAEIAGVGARNVSNVKKILQAAHPRLIEALQEGTLTINRAIQFCQWPRSEQLEHFVRYSEERTIGKVIRQALGRLENDKTWTDLSRVVNTLQLQELRKSGSVELRVGKLQHTVILVGQDVLAELHAQEDLQPT